MRILGVLVMVSLSACGGDPDQAPEPDAAVGSNTMAQVDAAVGMQQQMVDAAPAEELLAPYFETLKSNGGNGLDLTWTNETMGCSMIEVWRKDGLFSYAIVGMPTGGLTAFTDPTATQNQNYTYKLRCLKNGALSPYSWEMSANPQT